MTIRNKIILFSVLLVTIFFALNWYIKEDYYSVDYFYNNGNISVLQKNINNEFFLTYTKKNGNIEFRKRLPKVLEKGIVSYKEVVSTDDNIYVLGYSRYKDGYVKDDLFIVFDKKGNYEKHYVIENEKFEKKLRDRGIAKNLVIQNDKIVFTHGDINLNIYEYNERAKNLIISKKYIIDENVKYDNVVVTEDYNIYLTYSNGNIYYLSEFGVIDLVEFEEKSAIVPVEIRGVDSGNIVFYDSNNQKYYRYNRRDLKEINHEDFNNVINEKPLPNNIKRPLYIVVMYSIAISILIMVIVMLIKMTILFFTNQFGEIMPLLFKQLLIVIPVILFFMLIMYNLIRSNYENDLKREEFAILYTFAEKTANKIDGNILLEIDLPNEYGTINYRNLEKQKSPIFDVSQINELEDFSRNIYTELYYFRDGMFRVATNSTDLQAGVPIDYYVTQDTIDEFIKVYKNGKISTGVTEDGKWLYILLPVKNSDGKNVGVLETGMTVKEYKEIAKDGVAKILLISSIITVLIIIIISLVVSFLLKPIKELKKSVNQVAEGNFNNKVEIDSKDELGEIGRAFNKMSDKVSKYIGELEVLNKAYERFIPSEFISMLGKESVLDINKGDYNVKNLQIMYIDIKNYSSIMKGYSYDQEFSLLNKIYELCGKEILKSNGVIQEYTERGMIAVFDTKTDELLKLCLLINESLRILENTEKIAKIDLKISIDKGDVMLGIAGQEERISTVLISEIVNRLKYISQLSDKYGIAIVVSESIYFDVKETSEYIIRKAGIINIGKEEIFIYDVIYCENPYTYTIKENTKEIFEMAVDEMTKGNFSEARKLFINIIKKDDSDKLAKEYVLLCEKYSLSGDKSSKGFLLL